LLQLIAYDRVIDSAIALPGALAAGGGMLPDWRIVIAHQHDVPPFEPGCTWREGQLVWSINAAEQHLVVDRQLTVQTVGAAKSRSVSENAIANGLPALGWIAGDVVLHGAAVVMPGCSAAIAIMAPSGGGKSTLLNELMQAGGRLLADDTLVLRHEHGEWIGSGLPGGWFMRVDGQTERDFIAVPTGRSLQRAPVAAIIALTLSDDATGSAIVRQRGIPALNILLDHRHRPQVPRAMHAEALYLKPLAAIAAQVPIYRLTRQHGRICLTDAELAAMAGAINEEV
jgi:hypothetical protein